MDCLPKQQGREVQVAEEEGGDLGVVRGHQEVQGLRHHCGGGNPEVANDDIKPAANWDR